MWMTSFSLLVNRAFWPVKSPTFGRPCAEGEQLRRDHRGLLRPGGTSREVVALAWN